MERADKIFTIIAMATLIGALAHSHRRRGVGGNLSGVRLNTMDIHDRSGPSYLLSALPSKRRFDDYADPSSYFTNGGAPYQPDQWGDGQ